MGSVSADWVIRGPGTLSLNHSKTLRGQLYHYLGSLVPSKGLTPSFMSIYFHETYFAEYIKQRMSATSGLDKNLLQELTYMFPEVNPYVRTFGLLWKWAICDQPSQQLSMVIYSNKHPSNIHRWRYNAPSSSEVA